MRHSKTLEQYVDFGVPIVLNPAGSLRIPRFLFWHERNAKACQRPISFEFDFTNVGEIIRPVATDREAGGIAQIIAIETEFQ